jgi:hypothetical protein
MGNHFGSLKQLSEFGKEWLVSLKKLDPDGGIYKNHAIYPYPKVTKLTAEKYIPWRNSNGKPCVLPSLRLNARWGWTNHVISIPMYHISHPKSPRLTRGSGIQETDLLSAL